MRVSDLGLLLKAAADAGPGQRIELRDPIAAHGSRAIPPLRGWLMDARLGAFAVRTLERIAADPANRREACDALTSFGLDQMPRLVARDVSDALARLRPAARHTGATHRLQATGEQWPGNAPVSALELRFHDDMVDIFRRAGEETRRIRSDGSVARGYWASYFLRGVKNNGGPDYARQLLRKKGTTPGFERLTEEGRLDLTVEALVLRPEYASLFSAEERRIAAHRLAEAGFQSRSAVDAE